MISYGDAMAWCVREGAVIRFVKRGERPDFVDMNKDVPGTLAVEMAVDVDRRTVAVHRPLDSSAEPSKAVAKAIIECMMFLAEKQGRAVVSVNWRDLCRRHF